MADLEWRWNGSAWVEYTGGGEVIGYHVHTMDQVAGLEANLENLDNRLIGLEQDFNIGVPTGRVYVDLVCPGDVIRPRSDAGAIPPGFAVNWVKLTPPPLGGPYMQDIDTYERAYV